MARQEGFIPSLNAMDRRFCDLFASTGDKVKSLKEAGYVVPVTRNPHIVADELLNRQEVKDYLCVLGVAKDDDIEGLILRLGAMRRESWRRGDVKEAKSIDMEIAKLRGWLIERVEQKIETTGKMMVVDMSNEELMRKLHEVRDLLPQHGVKMLEDGKLEVIEGEYVEEKNDATEI